MEPTLYTGDRIVVDRLSVTWARLWGENYYPSRGDVIVFVNPTYVTGQEERFLVKRVIGFGGERVVLKDGAFTIYNREHPDGFDPDDLNDDSPGFPTSGQVDEWVPDGEIFVSGDHRQEGYSRDSRNGLGTIPGYDVIGPAVVRIYPLNRVRLF